MLRFCGENLFNCSIPISEDIQTFDFHNYWVFLFGPKLCTNTFILFNGMSYSSTLQHLRILNISDHNI